MKKMSGARQAEMRHGIEVGPGMSQVSPVAYWHREGHFESEEQSRGAFELAYQQGMDGMGASVAEWMGLTETELEDWIRTRKLPAKRRR